MRLGIAYRQRFNKDFLIDLVGYRRHGHNEADQPAFTQPLMVQSHQRHIPVRQVLARATGPRSVWRRTRKVGRRRQGACLTGSRVIFQEIKKGRNVADTQGWNVRPRVRRDRGPKRAVQKSLSRSTSSF